MVAARRDHPGDPGGLSGEDGCCVFADPGFGCGVAFFAVGPGGFRGYSRTWMESITIATLATFASVTGHVIGKSRASWVCASVPIRSICWLLLSTGRPGAGAVEGHGAVGLVEDVAATVAALSATLASSHLFAVTGPSVCSRRRCRCRSCPI